MVKRIGDLAEYESVLHGANGLFGACRPLLGQELGRIGGRYGEIFRQDRRDWEFFVPATGRSEPADFACEPAAGRHV